MTHEQSNDNPGPAAHAPQVVEVFVAGTGSRTAAGPPGLAARLMGNLLLAVGALLFVFVLVPFLLLLLLWAIIAVTFRVIRSALTGRGWVGGVPRDGAGGSGGIPSSDGAGRENVRVRRAP